MDMRRGIYWTVVLFCLVSVIPEVLCDNSVYYWSNHDRGRLLVYIKSLLNKQQESMYVTNKILKLLN